MSTAASEALPKSKSAGRTLTTQEAVCEQVLERLGKPPLLFKVDAHNVGGSNYRVNVWCVTPPAEQVISEAGMIIQEACLIGGFIISDSFYVKVSPEGGIVYSNPPIVKRY